MGRTKTECETNTAVRTYDARVSKPATVRHDARVRSLGRLVRLKENLALLVAHGSLFVHCQALDLQA